MADLKTWGEGSRCDECCPGDRCDDPTHRSREHCPHCKGTGWALWTTAGRRDYAAYLLGGNTSDKRAAILAAVDGVPTLRGPLAASDPEWLKEKLAMGDDSMVGGPPPRPCDKPGGCNAKNCLGCGEHGSGVKATPETKEDGNG